MLELCCLPLRCDKFILPARQSHLSFSMCVRLCAQLPSFTHIGWQRGLACGLGETEIWHVPKAPPTVNPPQPLPHKTPVLLPCLVMWARCLWVSLCHHVALSANIMPPSGRRALATHSLALFEMFACQYRLLIRRIYFLDWWICFTKPKYGRRKKGGYFSLEGVHTKAWLKCHSISNRLV